MKKFPTALAVPRISFRLWLKIAPPLDAWESWADRRDGEIRAAQSWRNLNRNYAGAEELDRHGTWRHAPEYGRVWVPHGVPAGWAPYRVGHWVWKPY